MQDSIHIAVRGLLSRQYIQSAAHLARLSAKVEKNCADKTPSDNLRREHAAYVTSSILLAVTFLEATINEFFLDARERLPDPSNKLGDETREVMAKVWDFIEGESTLAKFEIALILAKKPSFDRGTSPYQNVEALLDIRNALVHYKPKWRTAGAEVPDQKSLDKIEGKIRGKFPLNPITGAGNPLFPDKCLGHGCAAWAVSSSASFVDSFFSKLDLPTPLDPIRDTLETA